MPIERSKLPSSRVQESLDRYRDPNASVAIECAVSAAPDVARGEVLEAYVVLRHGEDDGPGQVKSIQNWVKTRFAAHAFPRQVHFTQVLPKTASGKVQRFVLRQQRREQTAANVAHAS